jgi:hypothetical protein
MSPNVEPILQIFELEEMLKKSGNTCYYYKKSCPSKPHHPATKAQKTIHIQLLWNYPLGITTIVQLSPWKYGVLTNKLPCQKVS